MDNTIENNSAQKAGFCKNCGTQLSAGQQFCPKCGTKVKAKKKTGVISIKVKIIIALAAVAVVTGLCIVLPFLPNYLRNKNFDNGIVGTYRLSSAEKYVSSNSITDYEGYVGVSLIRIHEDGELVINEGKIRCQLNYSISKYGGNSYFRKGRAHYKITSGNYNYYGVEPCINYENGTVSMHMLVGGDLVVLTFTKTY